MDGGEDGEVGDSGNSEVGGGVDCEVGDSGNSEVSRGVDCEVGGVGDGAADGRATTETATFLLGVVVDNDIVTGTTVGAVGVFGTAFMSVTVVATTITSK